MSRLLLLLISLLATTASASSDGETGVFGLGDPLELGLVGGVYSSTLLKAGDSPVEGPVSATLLGARFRVGGYTHKTLLGAGGGVEATTTLGYALSDPKGFVFGQLDALANIGLINAGAGGFVVRLHVLVGFGFSLWSGTSLAAGGRLALGLQRYVSLEAQWLTLPSVALTFSHRATAALTIRPIQLSLGAELNFGSMAVGESHFSLVGTACWRPEFK